jgi:hypothetical protein
MPINLSANRALGIRIHHVTGAVTADEFEELAAFYGKHPRFDHLDLVSLVDEGAAPNITREELNRLRLTFTALQARVRRRSAWVCPNVRAWPVLEDWLHERHSRDAMRMEVCLVADLADASCLFDRAEVAAVRDRVGFEEISHLEIEDANV